MQHHLPAHLPASGTPHSFTSPDGSVFLHFDLEAFDFHIDARPDYDAGWMAALLTQAEWWGLEPLPEDECEPELLASGSTRIYLTPIIPADVVQAVSTTPITGPIPVIDMEDERA